VPVVIFLRETTTMTDYESVVSYRKKIFFEYAVVGFIVATIILWFGMGGDLLAEVSTQMGVFYIVTLGIFVWIGGAIAQKVGSVDDSCDPIQNFGAIVRSLPLGLLSIAVLLAITWALLESPFSRLSYVAGLGYGYWVRWLAISRDQG
jgi:hypothetical protein